MAIIDTRPASPKQLAFITRLASERDTTAVDGLTSEVVADVLGKKFVSGKEASRAIDALLAAPKVFKPKKFAEPGYYIRNRGTDDAEAFVVVTNKAHTGTYAKRLVIKTTADGKHRGSWDYAPGVGFDIVAEGLEVLTLDEASEMSHGYGFCVVCGKTLENKESVERAIGPVCRKKFAKARMRAAAAAPAAAEAEIDLLP